jgi:hypothetical protein
MGGDPVGETRTVESMDLELVVVNDGDGAARNVRASLTATVASS